MSKTRSISQKPNEMAPGKALSQKEFEKVIENAEKGPFSTIEESKKMFQEWRKKNYKL